MEKMFYVVSMAKKLVITSGKGGVGKTTICSGLGYALAGIGYKTMLIDMDFGLNNLDILMGIENKIVYDVIDVLEGKCTPRDALIQDFFEPNLFTFPSTHGFCRIKFGAKELSAIIRELENDFDYILIDCPAGIDGGFRRAVACADDYLVVTTPHISAIRDASKVIDLIKNSNCDSGATINLIINRVRGDLVEDRVTLAPDIISKYLNVRLLGVVPEDDGIVRKDLYELVDRHSNGFGLSMHVISGNIVGDKSDIYDYSKKYRGAIGGIRRRLKRWI